MRPLIFLPADPARMEIGGIASFVRGFTKFAPADFEISMVGVSADLSLGRWHRVQLEDRSLRFMPVARIDTGRRHRVPIAMRFLIGLIRYRRRINVTGHTLSFHRPATDLPYRASGAPMWRVVHLTTADLATPGSESRWRWFRRLLDAVEHGTFRRMRRVFVVNEKATGDYRRRWPDVADRISFLPNWYDQSIFRPVAPRVRNRLRRNLRDELGIPASNRVLLFAGRLEGQKAPLLLVDAFMLFASAVTDVVLVICGDGSMRPDVTERVRAAEGERRVRLVGTRSRERLAEMMSASDALVISSEFETGPTVGYEALATGLPVVTTPVGQISRIVRSSGAGMVSADHTARALAAAIEGALGLPATVRGLASAASVPYAAATVLEEVYGYERALAAPLRGGVDP